MCLLSFSTQNHAESYGNYVNKPFLDPICAKLDKKSWFWHVQTCQGQSRPAKASPGGQVLVSEAGFYFCSEIIPFHMLLLTNLSWFDKIKSFINQIHESWCFKKIKCFTKRIQDFLRESCVLLCNTKGTYMENTQETYKEYSRNIFRNIQEYIRNIHKYLWYKIIRKRRTGPFWPSLDRLGQD